MCCYSDRKMKREFLAGLGRRKTLTAWKCIGRRGKAQYSNSYRYTPGINRPERLTKRYDNRHPSGLHVYLAKPKSWERYGKTIEVVVHRDDIIQIGLGGWECTNQAVVRKLTIRKAEWQRVFGSK